MILGNKECVEGRDSSPRGSDYLSGFKHFLGRLPFHKHNFTFSYPRLRQSLKMGSVAGWAVPLHLKHPVFVVAIET